MALGMRRTLHILSGSLAMWPRPDSWDRLLGGGNFDLRNMSHVERDDTTHTLDGIGWVSILELGGFIWNDYLIPNRCLAFS